MIEEAASEVGAMLRVRVGCDFVYDSEVPTPMMLIVRPKQWHGHHLLDETRLVEPNIPLREYIDSFGNHVWPLEAPTGSLRIRYDALLETPPMPDPLLPDLPRTAIDALPDEVLIYTLPSRHCQSDLFIADAWRMF